jgi:hypothetical protein
MLFLRSARTLSIMRRLALIAVGAAVAALLLLPAAAAWLRQPAPLPLPDPVDLGLDRVQQDRRASEGHVRTKLSPPWRVLGRTSGRSARNGARPVLLAPAQARRASTAKPNDDDDDSDHPAHAVGDDAELGDD